MNRWTKQCQHEDCYSYVADDRELCDFHMLEKYDLLDETQYDALDYLGQRQLIPVEAVLEAIRKAEQSGNS